MVEAVHIGVKIQPFETFLGSLLDTIREFQGLVRKYASESDRPVHTATRRPPIIGRLQRDSGQSAITQPFSPFEYVRRTLRSGTSLDVFINELAPERAPIIRDKADSWRAGCQLANEHFRRWTQIIRFEEIVDYYSKRKNYAQYISDLAFGDEHQMLRLCGYIAQGNYIIEKLRDLASPAQDIKAQLTKEAAAELARLEGLQSAIKSIQLEKQVLETKLTALASKHQLIMRYIEHEEEIQALVHKYDSCLAQVGDLTEQVQNLNVKRDKLLAQKSELEQLKDELSEEVRKLRNENAAVKDETLKLKNENTALGDIGVRLREQNEELEKTCLRNMELGGHLLALSEQTSQQYQSMMDALNREYWRDSLDGHIMISLFWLVCMNEIYRSLIEEKARPVRGDLRLDHNLDYDETVRFCVEVGATVLTNLTQYEMARKTIHSRDDDIDMRQNITSRIADVLGILRSEGESGLDRILEDASSSFDKVAASPFLKAQFVNPILKKEALTISSKLAKAMILACLDRYLRKYGQRY